MPKFSVLVAIAATLQDVAVADTPAAFRVSLTAAAAGSAAIAPIDVALTAPYNATFEVDAGNYTGVVQAIRADGSAIGTPIAFTVDTPTAAPSTVSAPVPSGVSVTVTAIPA